MAEDFMTAAVKRVEAQFAKSGAIYPEELAALQRDSAGQRQLLSFARTIIHKPSVMILDSIVYPSSSTEPASSTWQKSRTRMTVTTKEI